MADISEWSAVDESNNQPPPNGWPEGMAPSGVNNSARAVMGAVRRFYDSVNTQLANLTASLANYMPLSGGTLTGWLYGPGAQVGDLSSTGPLTVVGTSNLQAINATNIAATDTIHAGTTITAANAGISGTVFAGSAELSGNLTAAGIIGNTVHAYDTLSAGSSVAAPTIAASGNLSGGNISSGNNITATGAVFATAFVDSDGLFSVVDELKALIARVEALEGTIHAR